MVLTILLEDDGVVPRITTLELSQNFTMSVTFPLSSEKAALEPIMWLLALESRYHHCSCSLPTHLRWTWACGSSRLTAFRAFSCSCTAITSLLVGLNVVQCTKRRHHESGIIFFIISLHQMSFSLSCLRFGHSLPNGLSSYSACTR